MTPNLETTRRYLAALEAGVTGEGLRPFFHPDVVQIEHPNRLKAKGDRRELDVLIEDSKRGAGLMRRQVYELLHSVAEGDKVAVRVRWEGELAIDLGALKAGDVMRAQFAIFLRFSDSRIIEQHNYDCFDPF